MIENIILNKVRSNFYQINLKNNDQLKLLELNLKECIVPFGLEEYNNKYNINFEVDNQNEFIYMIRLLEKNLLNLLELNEEDEYEVSSVFSKKKNHNLLCKSYIKKNKNVIITKFIKDKMECSIFEIEKMKKFNIDLEVSGVWIFKKKCGLYLNIKSITNLE